MPEATGKATGKSARPRWLLPVVIVAVVLACLALAALAVSRHMRPILRSRFVAVLASHFHAHVTLQRFDVALAGGLVVSGGGLDITPIGLEQYPPAIQVRDFRFAMHPLHLFEPNRHVRYIRVDGLVLTFAPAQARKDASASHTGAPAAEGVTGNYSGLLVDSIHSTNAQVVILNDDPNKVTRTVQIPDLRMTASVAGGPMHYIAEATVPQPRGTIHAEGDFGPWNNADPRSSPITGNFTLQDADLSSIKGIGGRLTDHGSFSGPLNHLTLDGKTYTPDFRLAEANHPVALTANYHAIVDATTGDTYLQPVDAYFRKTHIVCTGSIVNIRGVGHRTVLDASIPQGRVEDTMWLAIHAAQPLLNGSLSVKTHIEVPPNPSHRETIGHRLRLSGSFAVAHASFTNPETDRKVDEASLRTQGRTDEAKQLSSEKGRDDVTIESTMRGSFSMQNATFAFHPAVFTMPGVTATMDGQYTLDGQTLHVNGEARLAVPVSRMVSGWKSLLLKPFDPLFRKDGAPALVHFHVDGPRADPEFTLDLSKHLSVGYRR